MDQITIDEFSKVEMRVGEVVACQEVLGSDKLLELHVNFGEEVGERVIFSGIKKWFTPESMVGRKLIFVINLQPKKFKIGENEYESNGMLVAAGGHDKAVLYRFDEDLPVGTILR